jgi:hypothetical protein
MRNLFLVFVIGIFGFGCLPKPIDIDVNAEEPKMVVASQVIPNKIMLVSLTKSFSALEGKDIETNDSLGAIFLDKILVKNALVTVSYLGKTDTLFMVSAGVYASLNVLQYSYGNYFIYAKDVVSGDEITAGTQLIPQVKFDTLYPSIIKNATDTLIKINFKLSDDPTTNNYYVINYIRKVNSNSVVDINQAFSRGNNAVLKQFELLDDNSFTNNVYQASKDLKDVKPRDSIAVILSHISKGYFEYLNAYKKSGALINQLTSEPINYPTNVNNGYGYFNAYYPTTRIFDLKNY